jgi:UDP:flavonoid glycosyltransferase YjiC (YdhE family)
MLGWPLSAEQFYNAKTMAEDMGVCIELGHGDGGAAAVAEAVETVLGETSEKRAAVRQKVAEAKEVIEAARGGGDDESSSLGVMRRFFDTVAPPT